MKHVLLALNWYKHAVHEGVVSYASEHGWQLNQDIVRRAGRLRGDWSGNGIIADFAGDRAFEQRITAFDCPIVTVNDNSKGDDSIYPSVGVDEEIYLEMVFDYFRRKGFRNFGYYGSQFAGQRVGFSKLLDTNGFECKELLWKPSDLAVEIERIRDWLNGCPLPMAVYCHSDDEACLFVNLAVEAGFDVPHDVAVIGTGNWEMACTSARVHVSSVDTNLFEVGYQAAAKLDMILNGDDLPNKHTVVPPIGIIERASTDAIGSSSQNIRKAIEIMERDYEKGISISDIVADIGISHSALTKEFRKELGYPPVVALRNIRMKAAALLLATTEEKVQTIAKLVGFNNKDYFQITFREHFGLPPRKYRLKAKAGEL